ncbi:MAG: hypothetical protein LLG04_16790 [Parachlamydia sp.]|nr:hypothetical protein [Parachlamydia sp.]
MSFEPIPFYRSVNMSPEQMIQHGIDRNAGLSTNPAYSNSVFSIMRDPDSSTTQVIRVNFNDLARKIQHAVTNPSGELKFYWFELSSMRVPLNRTLDGAIQCGVPENPRFKEIRLQASLDLASAGSDERERQYFVRVWIEQ